MAAELLVDQNQTDGVQVVTDGDVAISGENIEVEGNKQESSILVDRPQVEGVETLASRMTEIHDKDEKQFPVISDNPTQEEITEAASKCHWSIARQLFDEEVSKYTSAAQAAMATKDWSALKEVTLTVTMNPNGNRYCCWECGGSKTTNGHAVIIGAPDGKKPLAMSAFRKCRTPNGKQAVIQVWPGCIVAIATQSRGAGVVLLYRIAGIKPTESVYVEQRKGREVASGSTMGENVWHFSVVLQLNKVFNIYTHEVTQFSNDLNNINVDHDIIKAAIRKATIFNCQQAIYIRPFFNVKDGYKQWDIDSVMVDETYLESSRVSSFFNEILALLSNTIRAMPTGTFPYIGMKVVEQLAVDAPDDDDDHRTVLVKFAVFTEKKSRAWGVAVDRHIFHEHRDFFPNLRNFNGLVNLATDQGPHQVTICKYSGN